MKKICKKCEIEKPLDDFPDNTMCNGKRSQCKKCTSTYQKNIRENKKTEKQKEIRKKSKTAAKLLFKNGFKIDEIAKIFNVHYYTAKFFIEDEVTLLTKKSKQHKIK